MNVKKKQTKTVSTVAVKTRKRVKKARRRQALVTPGSIQISGCARDYITAVVSPFRNFVNLPCIPDFRIIPSFKYRATARGTMSTGSAGVGWIIVNPWTMAVSDATASGTTSDFPVIFTNSSYAGSAIGYTVSGGAITTTGLTGQSATSILASAAFSNTNLQAGYRLVACGVRIRYTGAPLYMQGSAYLARTPQNQAFDTSFDVGSELARDEYTTIKPISRNTEYVFYTPSAVDVTDYKGFSGWAPTQGGTGKYCLIIFVDGANTTNLASFMFEVVAYFEAIGVNFPVTPSHSDPVGYGAGLSSLPTTAPTSAPESILGQVLLKTRDTIMNNMSGFISNRVIPTAVNALGNYLYPPMAPMIAGSQPVVTEL